MTNEQIGDVISFAALASLWIGVVIIAVKRKRVRWDVPTWALTLALLLQALREVTAIARAFDEESVPHDVRWVIRWILVVVAIVALVATIRDRPPAKDGAR